MQAVMELCSHKQRPGTQSTPFLPENIASSTKHVQGGSPCFPNLSSDFGNAFHFTGFRIYDIVFGTERAQEATSQCNE
jgi:hypothetical protein